MSADHTLSRIDDNTAIPRGPKDEAASVHIAGDTSALLPNTPVPVTIGYDEGIHWVYIKGDGSWEPFPMVTFTGHTEIAFADGTTFTTDAHSPIMVTLPTGEHHGIVTANAMTWANRPTTITSSPVVFRVGDPTFKVNLPELAGDGTLPMPEQGRAVQVHVTCPEGAHFPGLTAWAAPDDRADAWALLERHGDGTTWSGRVVTGPAIGARRVDVRAVLDARPGEYRASAAYTAVDASPPALFIDHPGDGADVAVDDDMTIAVGGRLADVQSGVVGGHASVALALAETGPWTMAVPGPDGSWAQWSATISVAGLGPFVLHVRGTDAAGHTVSRRLALSAVRGHVPGTLDLRLGDSQYLAALMTFARDHVLTPAGPVTGTNLRDALAQPVDELAAPDRAAALGANTAENELRLPIRLLHQLLETADVDDAPATSAARHARFVAHHRLLNALGTTRTEIRRARGADPATRAALAARLGLSLASDRPDQLDALLLDSTEMTDEDLSRVFGLTPPRARPSGTPGLILQWQRSTLSTDFLVEDSSHPLPHALLDPDVVSASDVRAGTARADELRALLAARQAVIGAEESRLLALIRPSDDGADPAQRLSRTLAAALQGVTVGQLRDWMAADDRGEEITEHLTATGLDRPGLRWLVAAAEATAGTGTDQEEDRILVVWVLVAALRTRLTPTWRGEEAGVSLDPAYFTDSGAGPEFHPIRGVATARQQWRDRLATRVDAVTALEAAAAAAIDSAEKAALPLVRDGLVASLAPLAGDLAALDLLAARRQVDAGVSGALQATVIGYAITALQLLLRSVRARDQHPSSPTAGWVVPDEAAFDTGWRWLSTKAQWQRAVTGWLFPESLLDPAGTPGASASFVVLVENLAGAGVRLTPEEADSALDRYVAELNQLLRPRDVSVDDVPRLMRSRTTADQASLAARSRTLRSIGLIDIDRELTWAAPLLLGTRLAAAGHHRAALDWLWTALPWTHPGTAAASSVVGDELAGLAQPVPPDLTFPPGWTGDLNPYHRLSARTAPYTRAVLLAVARTLSEQGDAEFAAGSDDAVGQARAAYSAARAVLDHRAFVPVPPSSPVEGALPLPELAPLRGHVELQLTRIRQGRDIAGSPRRRASGSAPALYQPTPYRFATLLARSQEMTRYAAQIEALYLSMLERYDVGTLRLHEAEGALAVLHQQKVVHEQRRQIAEHSTRAATEQYAGAARVLEDYREAAAAPANQYEERLFSQFKDLRDAQRIANAAQAVAASVQSATSGILGLFASAVTTASHILAALAMSRVHGVAEQISATQLRAGIEERRRNYLLRAAELDLNLIAARHARESAGDQQQLAELELQVAHEQLIQADRTLALLQSQFTHPDLYLWLSRCIGGVYRYHLQQAAATARLAQAQLAFERAEAELGVIALDYWRPGRSRGDLAGAPSDTRGLTGAEYLQRDLARLDDYAFTANTRRLNVTQTFSLAELAPADLLELRRTGRVVLPTPEALFDQDFPGHHHRLVRSVRVSVVALVPPVRGIRATLSTNGISRVVTPAAHGSFTTVELIHEPTTVALSSAAGASGVFALDPQPELVAPFEGAGVDTVWMLELPPAANPFDYSSIADVQLTIDYTARTDDALRTTVIRRLDADRTRTADRVISIAHDHPDAWWQLHQPDPAQPDGGRIATFQFSDHDLPHRFATPRLVNLAGTALTGSTGLPAARISLSHNGSPAAEAVTDDRGVASTRRGAPAWARLLGVPPAGAWSIGIDAATAARLDAGDIDDLVLITSVRGEVSPWNG